MPKTKKILAVCLAVSAISLVIQAANMILSPETASVVTLVCVGIVPIVLLVALLSKEKK
jgi:hypothetical protein